MAYVDPARAPKVTDEDKLRLLREACIKTPCINAGTFKGCPFCPHWRKKK